MILPVCSIIMVYLPANFLPTTHRIAKVMADIRYRPDSGPFLTSPSKGHIKGPKTGKLKFNPLNSEIMD